MPPTLLKNSSIARRDYWIEEISRVSGNFGVDSDRIQHQISAEIARGGITTLLDHIRLCGAIPEAYEHDSTEEKLYSKYTDIFIHEAYKAIGFISIVLKERADVADVECTCPQFSFVADAKAFRLSRTAKNQKDFKVDAMNRWKHGKPFAMIVCPFYQLPSRKSQIYQQATTSSVCILTYTHLAAISRFSQASDSTHAIDSVHNIFKSIRAMNPSKDSITYWQTINRVLLDTDDRLGSYWDEEKTASIDAIQVARIHALESLAKERERVMHLSREDAIEEVLRSRKIMNRITAVQGVTDNGLLEAR